MDPAAGGSRSRERPPWERGERVCRIERAELVRARLGSADACQGAKEKLSAPKQNWRTIEKRSSE